MLPRILIADDHPAMRVALRATLERDLGASVCGEATNGLEAVQKAIECDPDLIILDLAMPLMNGLEAAAKIHLVAPDTPVLLYTVCQFPSLEFQAKQLGVRQVIDKASSVEQLTSAVEAALSGNHGRKGHAAGKRK